MAVRRLASTDAVKMPEELTWRRMDDPMWWAGDTKPARGAESAAAHRRQEDARKDFLSTLTVRPVELGKPVVVGRDGRSRPGPVDQWLPVGLDEWLRAHGLTRYDLGTASARSIGV